MLYNTFGLEGKNEEIYLIFVLHVFLVDRCPY